MRITNLVMSFSDPREWKFCQGGGRCEVGQRYRLGYASVTFASDRGHYLFDILNDLRGVGR
jgi:hypothetical protein